MSTKLKVLRAEKNLTQEDFAKLMGVKQALVSAWETGRAIPRPAMMQKISDFFKVPKEEIFFEAFNYSK